MHRTVLCHKEWTGPKCRYCPGWEILIWTIRFIFHSKSHLSWYLQLLCSFAEMLKGKDFQKPGKQWKTEKNGNISFIQILLEVYKCITDISKTSYPFHRARISSKVFTTVSGRAHTKGPLQTFLTNSSTPDTQHRLWCALPSQALWGFVYVLGIKAEDGQNDPVQERMCLGAGELLRSSSAREKGGPQALECEVRVQDRTKYFMEKHGN